ncbi:23 kDa integral membrane protein-like [Cydia fagiglandana]|uniref:23 kDa integral membrane protein-like n=1 Tax=Cydia fagiglandana TaxID=1458189 RepID=UPI002FEE08C1
MAISANCWKYLVLIFNVLFAMSAVVLFGVSGWLLYRLFIYRHFIGVNVEYPAILLLMMAIITCSIAWIGWRTATSMHQIHVTITGILLILVVVIEFACFVWAMVVWDGVDLEIKTNMASYLQYTLENKEDSSYDFLRWDKLHKDMQCCGVTGPGDFLHTNNIPVSCTGKGILDTLAQKPYVSDHSAIFQQGCGNPLHEYARQQLMLVAMTALVASVLQSSGIFCTFFLAHAIRLRRRASIRNSSSLREAALSAAPDDSLLSPSAPAHTLPKY